MIWEGKQRPQARRQAGWQIWMMLQLEQACPGRIPGGITARLHEGRLISDYRFQPHAVSAYSGLLGGKLWGHQAGLSAAWPRCC